MVFIIFLLFLPEKKEGNGKGNDTGRKRAFLAVFCLNSLNFRLFYLHGKISRKTFNSPTIRELENLYIKVRIAIVCVK